ncbi:SH3 domain-containing protein [Palleronia sp. LCG004]|nr:SH3 domain-containing protein [Palleronia sp. LCG004]WOI57550.1 SH3 domain-containing protein [Palleronia sp. LCG004]
MLVAGLGHAAPAQDTLGPVTHLPLPRFVSMKASEGNVRRGPSLGHRIDWVYRLKDLPLQITAEHGHWRRVEDRDGLGGWVHYSLLSGVRTVMIEEDEIALLMKPVEGSPENARLRRGVVARIEQCGVEWCRLRAGGYGGWTHKTALWGVEPTEIIE